MVGAVVRWSLSGGFVVKLQELGEGILMIIVE